MAKQRMRKDSPETGPESPTTRVADASAMSRDDRQALIQMRQVVKTFVTPAGDFVALQGIDAGFHRGEFVGVIGKSGSGKSTLVNMITGIDRPTSGQVVIDGVRVDNLNESDMARWRGRNLGIVFQFYQLLPMLSLLENVMLPMDFVDVIPAGEREARAMELLAQVGLADVANERPNAVSGGQQQSAAIARALANDPPIIIADEPTGNLDSRTADTIFRIFDDLARQGKTIIMVTHDSSLAQRATRTVLLADGEVIHEAVATALPLLTHEQMLHATHRLTLRSYRPGEVVVQQGRPNDTFYMVAKGRVEVVVEQPPGVDTRIAELGPGDHFGEVEILRSRASIATIRAATSGSAEVAALDRATFDWLMNEASAMREDIARRARQRMVQNAAARRRQQGVDGSRQERRERRVQAALA